MSVGIPTTHGYTRFRSRLEARWAVLFDEIGWRWEYEPFDADGYIPDFAILGDRPFLVEVKPALTLKELEQHLDKVISAGREALIVGASPIMPNEETFAPCAGLLLQQYGGYEDVDGVMVEPGLAESPAYWHRCRECAQVAVHHLWGGWNGYPCNHYDGDHYLGEMPEYILERMWAAARNSTQWRAT